MDNLALELVEYVKDDGDQNQEIKDLYKSMMYALEDMEYLSKLPEKFQKQEVVEDAWSICETRCGLLDPESHYYDDVIPNYLLKVEGIKEYFTALVLYEIERNIDKVFPENYEIIESEAIESVIKSETIENCEKLLEDYVEYMKEEYRYNIRVFNNRGQPYLTITEEGHTIGAYLDYAKIVEICETAKHEYYNIYFDYRLWK